MDRGKIKQHTPQHKTSPKRYNPFLDQKDLKESFQYKTQEKMELLETSKKSTDQALKNSKQEAYLQQKASKSPYQRIVQSPKDKPIVHQMVQIGKNIQKTEQHHYVGKKTKEEQQSNKQQQKKNKPKEYGTRIRVSQFENEQINLLYQDNIRENEINKKQLQNNQIQQQIRNNQRKHFNEKNNLLGNEIYQTTNNQKQSLTFYQNNSSNQTNIKVAVQNKNQPNFYVPPFQQNNSPEIPSSVYSPHNHRNVENKSSSNKSIKAPDQSAATIAISQAKSYSEMMEEANRRFGKQREQLHQRIEIFERQRKQLHKNNIQLQQSNFQAQKNLQLQKGKIINAQNEIKNMSEINKRLNYEVERMKITEKQLEIELQKKQSDSLRRIAETVREHDEMKRKYENIKYELQNVTHLNKATEYVGNKQIEQRKRLEEIHRQDIQKNKQIYQRRIKELQIKYQQREQYNPEQTQQILRLRNQLQSLLQYCQELKIKINNNDEINHKKIQLEVRLTYKEQQIQQLNHQIHQLRDMLKFQQMKIANVQQQYQIKINQLQQHAYKASNELKIVKTTTQEKQFINTTMIHMFGDRQSSNVEKRKIVKEQQDLFNLMLQQQVSQMNKLRSDVNIKDNQNLYLKNQIQVLKSSLSKLQQENNIQKMVLNANTNNLEQSKNNAEAMMRSEVQSSKRRLQMMQQRIKIFQEDMKLKDDFIRGNLIGKKQSNEKLVQKLEIILQKR